MFGAGHVHKGTGRCVQLGHGHCDTESPVGLSDTAPSWYENGTHSYNPLKADSHIACRAHAVPLPCLVAKGLECVFPIRFTQCGRVWFTLAMPRPCYALIMPFISRPRHSPAVERWPVGYLPAFGFSRLPHGVPRRLLSEAYQSSQRSIPTTVKSGSSTLQKGQSVKLLDYQFGYFRLPRGLSRRTRHCRSRAGARHGMY
jgi:hypothetical protein